VREMVILDALQYNKVSVRLLLSIGLPAAVWLPDWPHTCSPVFPLTRHHQVFRGPLA